MRAKITSPTRANRPETSLALTHLFTRGEDVNSLPDPSVLHDLQCMWYELEVAENAARVGDVIFALKNFFWVETHFEQIQEDEFDFHEYCIRKFSLNSYINLVRMEDRLRLAPAFKRAAKGAILCWLRVFDFDEGFESLKEYDKAQKAAKKQRESESDEAQFAGMTPTEKKRAQKKIKQEKLEQERLEIAKKLEESKKLVSNTSFVSSAPGKESNEEGEEEAADEPPSGQDEKQNDLANMGNQKPYRRRTDIPPDSDPKGFIRFASLSKDPLKPATQLVETILKYDPNDFDALLLAFDINIRKRNFKDAWKYLKQAITQTSISTPGIIERFIPFSRFVALGSFPKISIWAKKMKDLQISLDVEARDSLEEILSSSQPPIEIAIANLSSKDPITVLASADALFHVETEVERARDAVFKILTPYAVCKTAQDLLEKYKQPNSDAHKAEARRLWPKVAAFN